MTNQEAIKYFHQIYTNGGHCWLDEQRIEAISMAINALQEEPVSEDLEEASLRASILRGQYIPKEYLDEYPYDAYAQRMFKRGAKWQKQQDHAMLAGMEKMKEEMMANAIDVEVKVDAGGYPYVYKHIELYDYDKDVPLAKEGDKYKVVLIKEE